MSIIQRRPDRLNAKRILAQDPVGAMLEGQNHLCVISTVAGLAQANKAFIGINLNKYPVPAMVDMHKDRLDLCDFHVWSPPSLECLKRLFWYRSLTFGSIILLLSPAKMDMLSDYF